MEASAASPGLLLQPEWPPAEKRLDLDFVTVPVSGSYFGDLMPNPLSARPRMEACWANFFYSVVLAVLLQIVLVVVIAIMSPKSAGAAVARAPDCARQLPQWGGRADSRGLMTQRQAWLALAA